MPKDLPNILSYSSTDVLCFGANDGTATIITSGGTEPFTFYVDGNPVRDNNIGIDTYLLGNLSPGAHDIYFIDADGAQSGTITVFILQPEFLNIHIVNQTNVTCHGLNNGSVQVLGTGGNGDYQYSFDGGIFDVFDTFTNLAPGVYQVYVKDKNNCVHAVLVIITEPPLLTCTCVGVNPTAPSANDGFITATIAGGTYPITLTWSDGTVQTINSAGSYIHNNLVAGHYVLSVVDANGCTESCEVDLVDGSITIPPTPQNPDQDIINAIPIANCCLGDKIYDVFKFYKNGHTNVDCIAIPVMMLAKKIDLLSTYYTAGQVYGGSNGYFVFYIQTFVDASVSINFQGNSVTYVGNNSFTYDQNMILFISALGTHGFTDVEYDATTGYVWMYSPMNSFYNGQSPIVTSRSTLSPFGPINVDIITNNGFMGAKTPCNTDDLLVCITETQKDAILEEIRVACKTCLCGELTQNDIN